MGIGRASPYLVTMADGRVMAAGGSVADAEEECEDCETDTSTVELYDPVTDRWTPTAAVELVDSVDGEPDGLDDVIALSSGQVLATGENGTAALYDPVQGTWSALAWHGGLWSIALRDGTLLSFGTDYIGGDAEVEVPFAARVDTEGGASVVGRLAPADSAATAVLADGRLMFVGGVVEDDEGYLGEFLTRAVVFEPDTGLLSEIAPMPAPRGASTAVPLDDGSVLVVGGVDVWETQPATEEEEGNDTPGCVPVKYRVLRWVP
jgi:hypothetical protein